MRKKERYEKILAWLGISRPIAETELHYDDLFELLIAVILSAQCADKRINMITPALYRDLPIPEAPIATTPEVVYKYIRSASYPNNKTKHLVDMTEMLTRGFNSQVPDTLEELVKLPGVGRKTANVIQSVVFNKVAMVVDAHVSRVSRRLGLVSDRCIAPFSVEKELAKHIPEAEIPIAHHWLILHGRYICQAHMPQCGNCGLQLMREYYHQKYKVSKESNEEKEQITTSQQKRKINTNFAVTKMR